MLSVNTCFSLHTACLDDNKGSQTEQEARRAATHVSVVYHFFWQPQCCASSFPVIMQRGWLTWAQLKLSVCHIWDELRKNVSHGPPVSTYWLMALTHMNEHTHAHLDKRRTHTGNKNRTRPVSGCTSLWPQCKHFFFKIPNYNKVVYVYYNMTCFCHINSFYSC